MGLHFRRSLQIGPFRLNFSRGGVGYSVGGRGFRVGRSARGRTYTNVSLPGTGLGYRQGCLLPWLLLLPLAAGAAIAAWNAS